MSEHQTTGSRGGDVELPLRIDTPDDWALTEAVAAMKSRNAEAAE